MSYIIIIGALFAFWIYRDAKKWGYSQNIAILWALGSILAPYIAIPIYFLFGRKFQITSRQKEQDMQTIEAEAVFVGEMVDCPMCASKVQEDAAACPRCGYSLKLLCNKCGHALDREWKVCPYCQEKAPGK